MAKILQTHKLFYLIECITRTEGTQYYNLNLIILIPFIIIARLLNKISAMDHQVFCVLYFLGIFSIFVCLFHAHFGIE